MKAALVYAIPGATWLLRFDPAALSVLRRHVQRRWWSRETVGQLFSRDLTNDLLNVEMATVLPSIWAGFAGVRFDPKRAAEERAHLFSKGFHFVGFWHSHPEPFPSPSREDVALARDHALAAKPQLAGLVFAVIGTALHHVGLGVWVHDGDRMWKMLPNTETNADLVATSWAYAGRNVTPD